MSHVGKGKWICFWFFLFLGGCSSANRALMHGDDLNKVFPWPHEQKSVVVRVQPKTATASTFSPFQSYQQVEVNADTTFYVTDQTGRKFAYTPARSPIGRLAPVRSIEIRWPQKKVIEKTSDPSVEEQAEPKQTQP